LGALGGGLAVEATSLRPWLTAWPLGGADSTSCSYASPEHQALRTLREGRRLVEMWNGGVAATWFLRCARMRARPAGPAESSALHNFARSGPRKEAHRRGMNRSGGLLRSVAGQCML